MLEIFGSEPIRLYRNPNPGVYRRLAEQSKDNFVRAIITMDSNWYCWPGDESDHMGVITQTGMDNVIPVRLFGLPGGPVEVEVTETRAKLPTAKFQAQWVGEAVQRFVARQKIFHRISVSVIDDTPFIR